MARQGKGAFGSLQNLADQCADELHAKCDGVMVIAFRQSTKTDGASTIVYTTRGSPFMLDAVLAALYVNGTASASIRMNPDGDGWSDAEPGVLGTGEQDDED